MAFKILEIKNLDQKEKSKIDEFVLDNKSNGEFINSIEYLTYHPGDRFVDDSIVIKDGKSGAIKGIVMAAFIPDKITKIISHPGTTFSGPIFKNTQSISEIKKVLEMGLEYYKEKYNIIEIRPQPTIYASQPTEEISYLLMQSGFEFSYNALSNVINLSNIRSEEDIFKLYDSKRRNQVRKCIRDFEYDFRIEDLIDESIWRSMNANIGDKFNASTTHSFDEITTLKNKFPEQIIPYKVQKVDGQYGAFGLVYKFKNVFHTQYLDLNYDLSREYPNLLLIHNLLKQAISEGFDYFSFGPSTENGGRDLNEGLYNYKKGFGGGRIMQPVYKYQNS